MEFRESLEKLAQKAGVTLSNNSSPQEGGKKALHKEILEQITIIWQQNLNENKDVQDYLHKRGFTKDLINTYRLGYAPESWDFTHKALLAKGYTSGDIETVGLIKKNERGGYYDRFRSRVIFPLFDISGNIIAFSGRIYGDSDAAKYLNSPETPLFHKSKALYGINFAKNTMRTNNFACVVEGQVDMVMGQQVFPNTVATSGTSLTPDHLHLIKRFADRVVFVFDGDTPGLNSAYKGALLALAQDFEVKIATLPEGKDPADLILEDKEQYKQVIAQADDVFDLFLSKIAKMKSGREQTREIEERLFPLIAAVSNALEKDRYINEISQKLGLTSEALHQRISQVDIKLPNPQVSEPSEPAVNQVFSKETPTKRLAEILLWQENLPESVRTIKADEVFQSLDPEIQKFIETQKSRVADINDLSFRLENLYQTDIILQNEIQEILKQIEKHFSQYSLDKLKKQLTEAEQAHDQTKKEVILQKIADLLNTTYASEKNNNQDNKNSNEKNSS